MLEGGCIGNIFWICFVIECFFVVVIESCCDVVKMSIGLDGCDFCCWVICDSVYMI